MQLSHNERLVAGTLEAGILYNSVSDDFSAFIGAEVIWCDKMLNVCRRALKRAGVDLDTTPEPTPEAAPAATKTPCKFYRSIKAFYATAQAHGYATDDQTIKTLLSRLLGRSIDTRKTLTGGDWEAAASALKWEVAA